jgi:effector-binding domain-containing protein
MSHDFQVKELQPQPGIAIRETVANAEIPAKMAEMFAELGRYIGMNAVPAIGPPFAYYHSWNEKETVVEVGFPVAPGGKGEGRIRPMTLPGGKVVVGLHIGPYDKLVESYQAMTAWMKSQGHVPAGFMWEVYLSDPMIEKDPSKLMTQMCWPLA